MGNVPCLRCGAIAYVTQLTAEANDGALIRVEVCLCTHCRAKAGIENAKAYQRRHGRQPDG